MTKAEEVLKKLKHAYPDMPYYDDDKLRDILWAEWGQIEETVESGDEHRWTTDKTTYWRFEDDSWLAIDWASGNTENQENEGPYDTYLVKPYDVIVTKYRRIT